MKVIEDTQDRLVLGSWPWLLGLAILGAIALTLLPGRHLLLAGGLDALWTAVALGIETGALLLFTRRTRLTLDRRSGRVELVTRSAFGTRRRDWPLAELRRATIQTDRGMEGEGTRPVLLLASGPQPILAAYTPGEGAERAAAAINAWLKLDSEADRR